jgi:hypothetical protein
VSLPNVDQRHSNGDAQGNRTAALAHLIGVIPAKEAVKQSILGF